MELKDLFTHFKADGEFVSAKPCGDGHINGTYRVTTEGMFARRYILQRINAALFTDVPALMNNIRLVTEHIRGKVRARCGDPDRETLTIVPARDGRDYFFDGENDWRMFLFIENATSYSVVRSERDFYESAVAFGNFAEMLSDFDATLLYDVLPDFHDTRKRFAKFVGAVNRDRCGRAASVREEIEFCLAREALSGAIVDRLERGEMPYRVTHNDAKMSNVMIDNATGKGLAVIDLDTVMKGSVCYDYGDGIRFGCNPAEEDEPDLTKVVFSLPLFRAYTTGYLSRMKASLTESELVNLTTGAVVMTYESALRFLTDYLEGDVYFKTSRAGQNLDRTRTQIKLIQDMEASIDEMNAIVVSAVRA